ncbi:MAG: ABC transporter permease [Rhodothermales bacterium]
MFSNYFKVALRSLRNQKLYAFINIFGLALGLAFCCLITLYVRSELSFDQFHEDSDRIYRVYSTYFHPDGSIEEIYDDQAMPMGPAMQADLPEVEDYVRFIRYERFVKVEQTIFDESLLFTDPSFLNVFSFPLIHGDPSSALSTLNNVLLSETIAQKYFGEENPVGKRLSIRLKDVYEDFFVAGVLKDAPTNSSIQFDIVLPLMNSSQVQRMAGQWGWDSFPTFIKLTEDASSSALTNKLASFRAHYFPNEPEELREQGYAPGQTYGAFSIQSLSSIRMDNSVESDFTTATNPTNLYILAGIALAILLIACINFMTLAIGRSARRSREVGVRKLVGAYRSQLMIQFWGEAFMFCFLALGLSFLFIEFLLPVFNDLIGQSLETDYRNSPMLVLSSLLIMLATGAIAGSYPALVLSRAVPIQAIKNVQKVGGANFMTRSLVTFQFAISVFLMVCTFVMLQQLQHVNQQNLGFNKEQVVVIETQGVDGKRAQAFFQNELKQRTDIAGITGINNSFERGYWANQFDYNGDSKEVYMYFVDASFVDVMEMELASGRDFQPFLSSDSTHSVLVNEALVREFGWTSPVGEVLSGLQGPQSADNPTVIGVIEDFNFRSLHSSVEPMVMFMGDIRNLLIRISPDQMPETIAALEATWQSLAPDVPFSYSFLDDDLNTAYQNEQRWSKIIGYAAFLAILVASLGLFGLASLTVAGRTKEIGIRKVLGASLLNVTTLVSKEFALLVLIGISVGAPISYFAMNHWLDGFAYKVTMGAGVFLAAGVLSLLIALITVSYQSIGVALTDPVRSLRQE